MRESELQREVQALCRQRGLAYHHCRRADMCSGQSGMPDLVIFGTTVIFRELKTDGKLTPGQLEFSDVCARAGVSWGVWRPYDLESGRIGRELDHLAAPF